MESFYKSQFVQIGIVVIYGLVHVMIEATTLLLDEQKVAIIWEY